MQQDILSQLHNIGMNPSEYGVDESSFLGLGQQEENHQEETPDDYAMIDEHVYAMMPLLSQLDSDKKLYLISQIISLSQAQ